MKALDFKRTLRTIGVGAVWMLAACGSSPAALPEPTQVVLKDFMFQPSTLTVKVGATVTWVNQDDEPHTIKSDTGLFKSGALDTHESFSFKFDKPGTYPFTCSIHPRMTGMIVVQ
jgi:plastocyanin